MQEVYWGVLLWSICVRERSWTKPGIELWCICSTNFSSSHRSSECKLAFRIHLILKQEYWAFIPLLWPVTAGCGLLSERRGILVQGISLQGWVTNSQYFGTWWNKHLSPKRGSQNLPSTHNSYPCYLCFLLLYFLMDRSNPPSLLYFPLLVRKLYIQYF